MKLLPRLMLCIALATSSAACAVTGETPATMRQAQNIDGAMQVVEVAVPEPGPDQVRIRVMASTVNPFELRMVRPGAGGETPPPPPAAGGPDGGRPAGPPPDMGNMARAPGTDVAGYVDAVGSDVTGLVAGQKVFGAARGGGGWGEYALTPAEQTVAKPDSMTFEQAAAIPTVGFAAVRVFNLADPQPGDTIVIIGAAGGVGAIVTQLAIDSGATVVAVASSRHEQYLTEMGVDQFVPYDKVDVASVVQSADIVLNTARGQADIAVNYLRPGGRFTSIADQASAEACARAKVDCVREQMRGAPDDGASDAFRTLAGLADRGQLDITIGARFPLEEIEAALDELAAGHSEGKVAIDVTTEAIDR